MACPLPDETRASLNEEDFGVTSFLFTIAVARHLSVVSTFDA